VSAPWWGHAAFSTPPGTWVHRAVQLLQPLCAGHPSRADVGAEGGGEGLEQLELATGLHATLTHLVPQDGDLLLKGLVRALAAGEGVGVVGQLPRVRAHLLAQGDQLLAVGLVLALLVVVKPAAHRGQLPLELAQLRGLALLLGVEVVLDRFLVGHASGDEVQLEQHVGRHGPNGDAVSPCKHVPRCCDVPPHERSHQELCACAAMLAVREAGGQDVGATHQRAELVGVGGDGSGGLPLPQVLELILIAPQVELPGDRAGLATRVGFGRHRWACGGVGRRAVSEDEAARSALLCSAFAGACPLLVGCLCGLLADL